MDAAGKSAALSNVDGTFYAIGGDLYPQRRAPLRGVMPKAHRMTCPCTVTPSSTSPNGAVRGAPCAAGASSAIKVRVEGDDIEVELTAAEREKPAPSPCSICTYGSTDRVDD